MQKNFLTKLACIQLSNTKLLVIKYFEAIMWYYDILFDILITIDQYLRDS